jgi:hypothetical protein
VPLQRAVAVGTKRRPDNVKLSSSQTVCCVLPPAQGCAVDDVIATIVKSGGPENNGTQAEAVKWHDDKVGALLDLYQPVLNTC